MTKKNPFIEHNKCPGNCKVFFERRHGKNGSFYFCHRCKNTISEDVRGGPAESCGICAICGGLLFWRIAPNGNKYQACWTPGKHNQILSKIK